MKNKIRCSRIQFSRGYNCDFQLKQMRNLKFRRRLYKSTIWTNFIFAAVVRDYVYFCAALTNPQSDAIVYSQIGTHNNRIIS